MAWRKAPTYFVRDNIQRTSSGINTIHFLMVSRDVSIAHTQSVKSDDFFVQSYR